MKHEKVWKNFIRPLQGEFQPPRERTANCWSFYQNLARQLADYPPHILAAAAQNLSSNWGGPEFPESDICQAACANADFDDECHQEGEADRARMQAMETENVQNILRVHCGGGYHV